jgi:hypothetical protein
MIVCTRHLLQVGLKVEVLAVGTAWQFVVESGSDLCLTAGVVLKY